MKKYTVQTRITAIYEVPITARSKKEAYDIFSDIDQCPTYGEMIDVEQSEVLSIEPEEHRFLITKEFEITAVDEEQAIEKMEEIINTGAVQNALDWEYKKISEKRIK